MPRNGSGTYIKTMTAQPSTTISSSAFNTQIDDIATALTGSIPRDGQAGPIADIPAGGYKFTGVGNAASRNQFAAAGQVQDGAFLWGGTAGGTANALTANLSPAITAYAAGLAVRLLVTATNTGAATLALNGLASPKALALPDGTNLAGGEIIPGILECVYDGVKFRCTAGVSYISQALYDLLHPVNGPIQIRYDTTNPNTTLPTGVSATWTQIADTDAYLRINSGGTPGATGGSDSSSGALPNHAHSVGSLVTGASNNNENSSISGSNQQAKSAHTHDITGNTGNPTTTPNVTVAVRPKYRDFRAWRRTA